MNTELLERLRETEARKNRIATEAGELARKLDAPDIKADEKGGLKLRAANLAKAYDLATEDWNRVQADIKEFMAGNPIDGHLESGDGSDLSNRGRGSGSAPMSLLAAALKDAKFDAASNLSVSTPSFKTLTSPALTDTPRLQAGIVPMGMDRRWLFSLMPTQDAGTSMVIQDWKQTVRSLSGTVKRAQDATTDKASLSPTLTSVTEAIPQHAVVIEQIPNALLANISQLSAFLESEGEFQVFKSIDAHLRAQIVAATPPNGLTGTDLITQVRNAVAAHRALGANPTILALNPTDAAALDLLEDDGGHIFPTGATGSASPLYGLRVVEWIGGGTEAPLLIDPVMLGIGYAGRMAFDANPFTNFKKNLTDLRVETSYLFHVRNANGAFEIVDD